MKKAEKKQAQMEEKQAQVERKQAQMEGKQERVERWQKRMYELTDKSVEGINGKENEKIIHLSQRGWN